MKGIRIENLYGRFSYEIMLSDAGLTILTGPNGFGKSTILHIISAIANSDMTYFFDLDFSEIEILRADSKENFLIKRVGENLLIGKDEFSRQHFEDWRKYDVRRRYRHLSENIQSDALMEKITEIVFTLQRITGPVFFIEEQRLVRKALRRRRSRVDGSRGTEYDIIQVVEEIPDKMQEKMTRAASSYSRISNELDSTFPQRLFAQIEGLTRQEFDEKLYSMREKVGKLHRYGITNIGRLDDIQFKEEDARALKVYFEDFDTKYRQYEKLVDKLEMFTDIVNRRFQFKSIYISRSDGICVEDERKNEIPLLQLSSGEKETLVLFYQIIFEVPGNSILLIDEPEISLHIAWQRMFVEDIEKIIKGTGIQAVIATHSVQIVNGNKEIQRDLGGQYGERLNKG